MTPSTVLTGLELGAYRIEGVVGGSVEGGLVARGVRLPASEPPARVAVTLVDTLRMTKDARQALARRWDAAIAFPHPYLTRVLEYGGRGELMYVVAEWLDGVDVGELRERLRLRDERLPLRVVASIGVALAEVVHHLQTMTGNQGRYNLSLGHLSECQIFVLPTGHVKLLGFGGPDEVRHAEALQELDIPSLAHVAPEVLRGEASSVQSDLYGVALMLLTLASRDGNPVRRRDRDATLRAIAHGYGLDEALHDVDPELARLLRPYLARDPDDRPGCSLAFLHGLEKLLGDQGLMRPSEWRQMLTSLPPVTDANRPVVVGDKARLLALRIEDWAERGLLRTTVDGGRGSGWVGPGPLAWVLLVGVVPVAAFLLALAFAWIGWERTAPTAAPVGQMASVDPGGELLDRAERAYEEHDFDRALRLLDVAAQTPDTTEVGRIRRLQLTDRVARAIAVDLARTDANLGRLESARRRTEDLVEIDPSDGEARVLLAEIARLEQERVERRPTAGPAVVPPHDGVRVVPTLGRLTVETVPTASVAVDGEPLGASPVAGVELAEGPHDLSIRVAGFEPLHRRIVIESGEDLTLHLELDASAKTGADTASEAVEGEAPDPVPEAPRFDASVAKALPVSFSVREYAQIGAANSAIEARLREAGLPPDQARGCTAQLTEEIRRTWIASVPVTLFPRATFEVALGEAERGRTAEEIGEALVAAHRKGELRDRGRKR